MSEQVGASAGPENVNPQVVEAAAETPAEEINVEANAETASPQETDRPKRNGFTRKIERLQAENAEIKAKLAELTPQPKENVAKRPSWDDYAAQGKTSEQYFEDLADYKADERITKVLSKQKEDQQQQNWQREQRKLQSDFQKKASEFAKTTPDFEKVTQENDIDMSPALGHALLESDKGPELAYYLAKNLDEAEELNKMSYGQIARHLGRLEAKIESKPVQVKTTTAPAPINPVGSKANGELNPYMRPLNYEEHLEWRAKQK